MTSGRSRRCTSWAIDPRRISTMIKPASPVHVTRGLVHLVQVVRRSSRAGRRRTR
jgi:hypothetical protein